jgi:hypothetical protein
MQIKRENMIDESKSMRGRRALQLEARFSRLGRIERLKESHLPPNVAKVDSRRRWCRSRAELIERQ